MAVRRPRGNSAVTVAVRPTHIEPHADVDIDASPKYSHGNSNNSVCGHKKIENTMVLGLFIAFFSLLAVVWWQYNWITLEIPTRITSLHAAVNYYAANPQRSDIIVSMTTVPGRERLLTLTVKCLLLQTVSPRAILIHTPLNSRFPTPVDLKYLEDVPGIQLFRHEKDLGPSMKAIPTILSSEADQRIIYLDHDTLYPREMVADFEKWSKILPDAALTGRGWRVADSLRWVDSPAVFGSSLLEPLQVDIATGCGAVLVKRRFFDTTALVDYASAPKEAFFVDDIWLSGNLARQGVRRFIIPTRKDAVTQIMQMTTLSLSGGVNADGHNNDIVIKHFEQYWILNTGEVLPWNATSIASSTRAPLQ